MKFKTNKKIINSISIIGILVLIILLYKRDIINLPKQEKKTVSTAEDLGVTVEVEKVKEENIIERLSYTASIYPKETVQLNFKIPGKITQFNVSEGNYVEKGEKIAKLDGSSIEAKLNTIQSKKDTINTNLIYLQSEEEKYRELLEGGAIPESSYDKIVHEINLLKMQFKELEAQKSELEVNQSDLVLISPISGIVKSVNGAIGEIGGGGQPLVVINHNKNATVKVNVSESDLNKLKVGTKTILTITGVKDPIETSISKIASNINPETRIGSVEIQNINSEETIIFGSSVYTEFIIQELESQIVISEKAIKQLKDKEVVYKIDGDHVNEIPIKTGIRINNRVQIIEGLESGDNLSIKNLDKLYDGAKIYVFKGE